MCDISFFRSTPFSVSSVAVESTRVKTGTLNIYHSPQLHWRGKRVLSTCKQ